LLEIIFPYSRMCYEYLFHIKEQGILCKKTIKLLKKNLFYDRMNPAVNLLIVFYFHILLFFIHYLLGMLYSWTRSWILNDEREGEQIRKVKNIQYGICDKTTKHCIIERDDSRRSFCGSNRCCTCPVSRQMDSAHSSW
jgi:hypothetical protein